MFAQSTSSPSASRSSAHLALLKFLRVVQDHSCGEGNLRSNHSCCTPNAITRRRAVVAQINVVHLPARHTSSIIHCLVSVVRNRAIGGRLGVERKGNCGRDRLRVFWVKGRGPLGRLKGRKEGILRMGSRDRILGDVDSPWPPLKLEVRVSR